MVYSYLIYLIYNKIKIQYSNQNTTNNNYRIVIILLLSFMLVLSYLSVDFFAIMLAYIFPLKYVGNELKKNKQEENNET